MKKHKCKTPHIINSETKILKIKCPSCGSINEHKIQKVKNCWDGGWEDTGFSEDCFYCHNWFTWQKEMGISKGKTL